MAKNGSRRANAYDRSGVRGGPDLGLAQSQAMTPHWIRDPIVAPPSWSVFEFDNNRIDG